MFGILITCFTLLLFVQLYSGIIGGHGSWSAHGRALCTKNSYRNHTLICPHLFIEPFYEDFSSVIKNKSSSANICR